MRQKKNRHSPLDMEEKESEPLISTGRRNRIWFYLEWIPISLLSLGIWLRFQDNDLWKYLVIGGGLATAVIYLLFSTILLNPQKNNRLEMMLSAASGLLVAVGVGSLIAKYLYWEHASLLIQGSIYAGLGMIGLVAIAFLFNIRQATAARFYRDLLARLFIFIALIYSLGV